MIHGPNTNKDDATAPSPYALLSEYQIQNAYAFSGTDAVSQEVNVFFDSETLLPVFASYY